MKTIKTTIGIALLVLGVSSGAQAHPCWIGPSSTGYGSPIAALNSFLDATDGHSTQKLMRVLGSPSLDRYDWAQARRVASWVREGSTLSYERTGPNAWVSRTDNGQVLLPMSRDKKGLWHVGSALNICD